MPHGDFSDVTALFCAIAGGASILKPELWFKEIGPMKPLFDGMAPPQALTAIQFAGGLLMLLAPIFFVVRWNTVNGKAAAIGCGIGAINSAVIAFNMDGGKLVFRGWHVFSLVLTVCAVHMAFNANPMLTSKMLAEKEQAKAAKKK